MNRRQNLEKTLSLLLALALLAGLLSGCARRGAESTAVRELSAEEDERYLIVVDEDPDTVDFQCTSIYYTVALNVFNRLVELESTPDGGVEIVPSLAESWEVSDDGLSYTFHLRRGVTFSNGLPLTASDVGYTLSRLLTHPDSCNRDVAAEIVGAEALAAGRAARLEGFNALSDYDFVITLNQPFAAFLACLSMPGASILDRETTAAAGRRFGHDPACTVGTGAFVIESWTPGSGMRLKANPNCWEGLPGSAGLDLRFLKDAEEIRRLFEEGKLDILDLDDIGSQAEYFIHGDIYRDRLYQTQQTGISYIALNESVRPLGDVRVRKALQLALDRQMLLDVIYSGRGTLENGIFPAGLDGHNPALPEIPCDPEAAHELLAEAGYGDGFAITIGVKASSNRSERELMGMVADMWGEIGVRAEVQVMDESEFMRLRKSGQLACYTATWSADFDDPDNFIYTFFGNRDNTIFRSLCYPREDVMARVRAARTVIDRDERMREYQDLEKRIIQDDAAWIPLFSRLHYFVAGERVENIEFSWNGWVSTRYRYITLKEA